MTEETSREAYHAIVEDGTEKTQEERILRLLAASPGEYYSARDVGILLELEARTAGSRIAGLVNKELVRFENYGIDRTTGKRVKMWAISSAGKLALAAIDRGRSP